MLPRSVTVFAGVVLLGALIPLWALPGLGLHGPDYWLVVVAVAIVAAIATRGSGTGARRRSRSRDWIRRGEFLCDACKYDHPDLCSRPERPNATQCPEYTPRI